MKTSRERSCWPMRIHLRILRLRHASHILPTCTWSVFFQMWSLSHLTLIWAASLEITRLLRIAENPAAVSELAMLKLLSTLRLQIWIMIRLIKLRGLVSLVYRLLRICFSPGRHSEKLSWKNFELKVDPPVWWQAYYDFHWKFLTQHYCKLAFRKLNFSTQSAAEQYIWLTESSGQPNETLISRQCEMATTYVMNPRTSPAASW